MQYLVMAINRTNMQSIVDGKPLSDELARRDVLKLRLGILRDTVNRASNLTQRSRGDEIRQLAAVDVRALQKQCDALSRDYRMLDNRIQAANWSIELIEG